MAYVNASELIVNVPMDDVSVLKLNEPDVMANVVFEVVNVVSNVGNVSYVAANAITIMDDGYDANVSVITIVAFAITVELTTVIKLLGDVVSTVVAKTILATFTVVLTTNDAMEG